MVPTVTCSVCGITTEGETLLTWALSIGPRGVQRTCERCTREHLRSIEGKLGEAWW